MQTVAVTAGYMHEQARRDCYRKFGHCPGCGHALAGRFDDKAGTFGRKRIPIALGI